MRSGSLWCSVMLDPNLTEPHLAFAVGKSAGSAVVRNRIRRRLRPQFVANADVLPAGYLLVGASGDVATMPAGKLAEQVSSLIERVRKVAENA